MIYQTNLIKLANYVWNLPNGRSVQLYTKNNLNTIQMIVDNTSFLPINNKISSRCYCIIHNIHKQPTCKMCDNPVKWKDKSFGIYCSVKCKCSDIDIKNKVKNTVLTKFGVENPSQSNIIKQKKVDTCNKNYGVDYPQQNKQVLHKSYDTMRSKYGAIRPIQNKIIQDKIKQTVLKNWGVENPSQSEVIQNKKNITMLELYGVTHSSQSHMIDVLPLIKDYNWLFDQYINQQKSAVQISKELGISDGTVGKYLKRVEIEVRTFYTTSCNSISWLTQITEQENIYIQHALNEGEYSIPGTRYRADGYCKETNTIYEFHGDYWHGNPKIYPNDFFNKSLYKTMGQLYQETTERDNLIKSMGYNLVVMWESDFNLSLQM